MAKHIKSISAPPMPLRPWQKPKEGVTTIGVIDPCYGSSHVIYGLDMQRYRHRTLSTLPLKKLDRKVTFFRFTPLVLDTQVPLLHTWNAIPLNRDFIVSFELEMPRYLGGPSDAQVRYAMRLLSGNRCKGLLALSDFAYNFAKRRFEEFGYAHLTEKMQVFRGAIPDVYPDGQQRIPRINRPSFVEKPLSAVVIGTQLFRKGGMYAITAFERLRAKGLNVALTLIGDFERESYAFGEGLPDAAEWRARARSHDWIRFVGPIPNSQVFPELLAHDLTIYTSLDESLGWLPIEAQMLGVPVVGAAVCAFPELVADRQAGWLVELPLREDGRWSGLELQGPEKIAALAEADERIVAGIVDCMEEVYRKPELIEQWGAEGHRRMTALYGMEQASRTLERIYDSVLD